MIHASIVLACDGISGSFLRDEPWANWRVARRSWMGASAILDPWPHAPTPGAILMHIGPGGYAGLVRLADGRVHLGAAFDPKACRRAGGPRPLISSILAHDGPPLDHADFIAAGLLTRRRRRLAGHRVLAIGDACGYVEPFTGQGIAWALLAGRLASDLLDQAGDWSADLPRRWEHLHHRTLTPRQRWCRALRPLARHPTLASIGLSVCHLFPPTRQFLAAVVCDE